MLKKDGLCLNKFYCCGGEKVFSAVGLHHAPWNKGMPPSEETRKRIGLAHKGTHHSEETKQKISLVKKGIPRSEETKQKIGLAHKGTHHSEEHKKKIGLTSKGRQAWNKGTHPSEETKKKMSEAATNRIKISIKGITFESITEASKYYNVVVPVIRYWLKTGNHNAFYIEKCPKI